MRSVDETNPATQWMRSETCLLPPLTGNIEEGLVVAENVKNARSAKKEGEGKNLENVVEIASSEGCRYVCIDVCMWL